MTVGRGNTAGLPAAVQKAQIGSCPEGGWLCPVPFASAEPLCAAQIAESPSEAIEAAPSCPMSKPLNNTCNANA
jgi:hypothetical protein